MCLFVCSRELSDGLDHALDSSEIALCEAEQEIHKIAFPSLLLCALTLAH